MRIVVTVSRQLLAYLFKVEDAHAAFPLIEKVHPMDKSGIKIAEYLTELPSKRLLKQKLQKTIELAKERFENKE